MPTANRGLFWWKVTRPFVLVALIAIIVLMLQKPQPVAKPMAREAARARVQEFNMKMQGLEASHQRGETAEAQFTSEEINALMQEQTSGSPGAAEQKDAGQQVISSTAAEPVKVSFLDDHVTGQAVANVQGKDVYITVSGRLGVSGGYLTFEPTKFKIGDLPVPVSLVSSRLQSKLNDPETHEKLKLPDFVSDLRVDHGQLVIVEK